MLRKFRRAAGDIVMAYLTVVTGYWVVTAFRRIMDAPIPSVKPAEIPARENYTGYNETPSTRKSTGPHTAEYK